MQFPDTSKFELKRIQQMKRKIRMFQLGLPVALLLMLVNLENKLRRTGTRISVKKDLDCFHAQDNRYSLYFTRPERILLYAHGLTARLEDLAHTYHLNRLEGIKNSILLDCGANVGEVSLYAGTNFDAEIIAVEPEPSEFACLTLNLQKFNARCVNKLLWSEVKTLKFYSKPDTADSSAIYFGGDLREVEVAATTVDELFKVTDQKKSVFLKIEAEGAEPEVLVGAHKTLDRAFTVVIDGGPERGVSKERTEPENDSIMARTEKFIKVESGNRTQLYVKL